MVGFQSKKLNAKESLDAFSDVLRGNELPKRFQKNDVGK